MRLPPFARARTAGACRAPPVPRRSPVRREGQRLSRTAGSGPRLRPRPEKPRYLLRLHGPRPTCSAPAKSAGRRRRAATGRPFRAPPSPPRPRAPTGTGSPTAAGRGHGSCAHRRLRACALRSHREPDLERPRAAAALLRMRHRSAGRGREEPLVTWAAPRVVNEGGERAPFWC